MREPGNLQDEILAELISVIDPETGVDVLRMRLVRNLMADHEGVIYYDFCPSSPVCPLAVSLVIQIYKAVDRVQGVTRQEVGIVNYFQAARLKAVLTELEQENAA